MVIRTEHVFFRCFAVHDFFWIYDVFRIFFNIPLELFCVFRNTEYNVSKYVHFSLYCFISYCEFIIVIVLKSFSNHLYLDQGQSGGG